MGNFESIIFYIVIAIISTCFFALHKHKSKAIRYIGIIFSILIPSIIAGIRFNVGTDYPNYYWTFEHLEDVSYESIITGNSIFNMDSGFLFISKLLSTFLGSRAIFGVWGAVILIVMAATLYSLRNKYDTTLIYYLFLLLYYFNSFNILRQIVAACIIFWGIRYIIGNKPIKYILTIGIASIIHFSALLALPMWFLWDKKRNKTIGLSKKTITIIAIIIFILLWQTILQRMSLFNLSPITKYSEYISGNNHSNVSFFVKLAFVIIFYIFRKPIQKNDETIKLLLFMFFISAMIDFTGYYSSFVKRSSIYYSMGEIVIFSRFALITNKESRRMVRLLVAIAVSSYFVLGAYVLQQGGLIPFTT